jgi:hypothetical protein
VFGCPEPEGLILIEVCTGLCFRHFLLHVPDLNEIQHEQAADNNGPHCHQRPEIGYQPT